MKVLELLEEIEEIVDTASGFPLTGKIMVDSQELLELVREIRVELPDEIQQAQWIKNERERILTEAKKEYETVIADAQAQAERLVENHDITVKAKLRADELMKVTESAAKQLKLSTYDYVDGILSGFQDKMEQLNGLFFNDMVGNMEKTFGKIDETLAANRSEINDMAYRTQQDADGVGAEAYTDAYDGGDNAQTAEEEPEEDNE
ncbi:MAG: ATPase [Firmicutes bacterium]|nr:ATPase [Bacillota bacterium]